MERRSNKLHTCHCWGMKLVSGKIIPRTWFGWKTTNFFFGKSHVLKGDLFYCSCIFSTNSFFKFLKKFVEGVMGGIWRVLKERLWGISLRVFDYSMLRSEGNFRLFFWLRRWGGSFLLFYLFFCRDIILLRGFLLGWRWFLRLRGDSHLGTDGIHRWIWGESHFWVATVVAATGAVAGKVSEGGMMFCSA